MRALVALVLLSGCSDDSCGIGGAPASGLVATGTGTTLTYGALSAGANNDCPAADAPSGVVSLTITGTQTDGTGLITICIGRPDKLAGGLPLGTDPDSVQLIDTDGSSAGCTYALDPAGALTGTAKADGICGNGTDAAGFALTVDGGTSLERTCNATVDSVAVTFSGRVAVTHP